MKITIQFETDNAAFEDDASREVDQIMEAVSLAVLMGVNEGAVRDTNGNTIGKFTVEED